VVRALSSVLLLFLLTLIVSGCFGTTEPEPVQVELESVEVVTAYDPDLTLEAVANRIRVMTDNPANDRLQRLGARLAATADLPEDSQPVKFLLIDGPGENGWVLPPATVAVTEAMMRETSDAHLAVVLGHLLAHIKLGNHQRLVEIIRFDSADLKFSEFRGLNPNDEIRYASARVVADLAATGFERAPVTQGMAIEADHEGAYIMARAGFDPRVAVGFWEHMISLQEERGTRPLFMIVYDAGRDRIDRLKARMPDYLDAYGMSTRREIADSEPDKASDKKKSWFSGLFDWWE